MIRRKATHINKSSRFVFSKEKHTQLQVARLLIKSLDVSFWQWDKNTGVPGKFPLRIYDISESRQEQIFAFDSAAHFNHKAWILFLLFQAYLPTQIIEKGEVGRGGGERAKFTEESANRLWPFLNGRIF